MPIIVSVISGVATIFAPPPPTTCLDPWPRGYGDYFCLAGPLSSAGLPAVAGPAGPSLRHCLSFKHPYILYLYYHFSIHQVIQVYVVWPEVSTNIPIPKVQLVAFTRQEFSAGEHRLVKLLINPERYAVWGDHGWTFIKGSSFHTSFKIYNKTIQQQHRTTQPL